LCTQAGMQVSTNIDRWPRISFPVAYPVVKVVV